MLKIASVATYPSREDSLLITLSSIRKQVDLIYVHVNDYENYNLTAEHRGLADYISHSKRDLTDNGKFYALSIIDEPCYFFTLDDDLWYHPDYVSDMVKAIDKYKCIVSHHGRILVGKNRNYYTGHRAFKCLASNPITTYLDVCGTGVTGFRTDYFEPLIWNSNDLRMSDLVFSYEAAKRKKKIIIIPHPEGWVKQVGDPLGIWGSFREEKTLRQNEIADKIFDLKFKNQ